MFPLLIGMAAAAAAGGVAQGLIAKGGADAAGRTAREAAQNAENIRYQNQAVFSPWNQSGQGAQNQISQLLGLGHYVDDGQGHGGLRLEGGNWQQDQQNAFARFQTDPGYQFRFNEGQRALDRSAAAKGTLFSGATNKASQAFGQGLGSQEYGNWFNRLAGVGQQGLTAAQGTAQSNLGTLGQQNNALSQVGQAQIGSANALANGIGQGLSNATSIMSFGMGGGAGAFGGGGLTSASQLGQIGRGDPAWGNIMNYKV